MLSKLQNKAAQLTQDRLQNASDYLADGISCLLDAEDEGYQDRELLVEACENFMEAMRLNHNAPEPCIGMAYLLLLLGEYHQAFGYVTEALSLDPQNEDAHTLSKEIQKALAAQNQSLEEPFEETDDEPDFDLLYEQLQAQIKNEVHHASTLPPKWLDISDQRFQIEKTERLYIELRQGQEAILEQCKVLETEIDCSALRQMMRPLDIILNRCKASLTQSWQLVQLEEMMQEHNQWLNKTLKQLGLKPDQMPADFSQQRFEYLLEDCDALADQLDELEQRQIEISALVVQYEILANRISELQDLLDQVQH